MQSTGQMDLDICQCWWLVEKIRGDDAYAQNLYAAMCNQEWQYQDVWSVLTDKTWSCTWRGAGAIIADIRGEGDYLDWYCSGIFHNNDDTKDFTEEQLARLEITKRYVGEGRITEEILEDLAGIGWHPMVD
jgi:hypothetical protein